MYFFPCCFHSVIRASELNQNKKSLHEINYSAGGCEHVGHDPGHFDPEDQDLTI